MYLYTLFGTVTAILTPYQFINWPNPCTVGSVNGIGVEEATSASPTTAASPIISTESRGISTESIKSPGTEAAVNECNPQTVYLTSMVRVTVRTTNHSKITLGRQTTAVSEYLSPVETDTSSEASVPFLNCTQISGENVTITPSAVYTILTYSLHPNHIPKFSVSALTLLNTSKTPETTVTATPISSVAGLLETTLYLTVSMNGTAHPYETSAGNYGTYLAPCFMLLFLLLLT